MARLCDVCGQPLVGFHGNRRVHPGECMRYREREQDRLRYAKRCSNDPAYRLKRNMQERILRRAETHCGWCKKPLGKTGVLKIAKKKKAHVGECAVQLWRQVKRGRERKARAHPIKGAILRERDRERSRQRRLNPEFQDKERSASRIRNANKRASRRLKDLMGNANADFQKLKEVCNGPDESR